MQFLQNGQALCDIISVDTGESVPMVTGSVWPRERDVRLTLPVRPTVCLGTGHAIQDGEKVTEIILRDSITPREGVFVVQGYIVELRPN